MAIAIPCRTDLEHYTLTIPLDGVRYQLAIHWATREEAYYVALYAEDGTTLISGAVKVVVGFPLMQRCVSPSKPPGMFIASDTSGLGIECEYGDLGGRVQLVYFEAADLPLGTVTTTIFEPIGAQFVIEGG
jgi:hypothetical protein